MPEKLKSSEYLNFLANSKDMVIYVIIEVPGFLTSESTSHQRELLWWG